MGVLLPGPVVVRPEGRFELPLLEKLMVVAIPSLCSGQAVIAFIPSVYLGPHSLGLVFLHQLWELMAVVGTPIGDGKTGYQSGSRIQAQWAL